LLLRDLHPRRFFLQTWQEIDAEATRYRRDHEQQLNTEVKLTAFIFSVVAVSLLAQEYFGDRQACLTIISFIDDPLSEKLHPLLFRLIGWLCPEHGSLRSALIASGYFELVILSYWAIWRVFGFFIFPALAAAFYPTLRKRPLGFSFKSMGSHLGVYAVLVVPVLIAVFIVSFSEEFSSYYPFYDNAHRSFFDFAVWELLYIAQFFALEFFFRGFMLQPLRHYMGSSAIFAMMVPYVLIHVGKPILECFAAIIAGIVLGTLAMRTRSIWLGFLIHVTVALSMDLIAIWQVHF